ncbi:MAG: hypothetical protein AAF321_00255 [Pseudomonadota bacterium]
MANPDKTTLNRTEARQGREGKPVLMVLIASTAAIVIAMGILMVMAGSNETPDGFGVVEQTGSVSESLEQPTAELLAEPMEVPTSAQPQ